jgi:hypothetical protein
MVIENSEEYFEEENKVDLREELISALEEPGKKERKLSHPRLS